MNESPDPKRGCGCAIAAIALSCSCILLVIYCIFFFPIFRTPIAKETFDEGANGWLVVGDAQGDSNSPSHVDEGGNPGPFMSAKDDAVGGIWYWAAPDSFLKTVSEAWEEKEPSRSHLYFDLKQSDLSEPFEAKDVILASEEKEIYFNHSSPPGLAWTSYSVPFRPDNEWLDADTDEPVEPEEFQAVLANLNKLWIRGEFRTGEDVGGIDNITVR